MLRHIVGDRFEADTGDRIQIVTQSQNNNGINDARFEYAGATLPREKVQGLPGCTFTVQGGRKQFQAVVMFDGAASPTARYDLFEVDEVGALSDLQRHVTKLNSSPLVGLAVEGMMAAVPATTGGVSRGAVVGVSRPVTAGARMARAAKKTKARKKRPRKSAKKSSRKSAARKTTRKASRKPARKTTRTRR